MNVHVAGLHFPVTALGPGARVGVWFQGCSIHCPGCIARDTWDPGAGTCLPLPEMLERISSFPADEVAGITISGGEPFDQADALLGLVEWLRGSYCGDERDILLYSGYPLPVLRREHRAILECVDALISEPFDEEDGTGTPLRWRGSPNQVLTPLTPLGHARYASELAAPSRGEIQVIVGDGGYWMVGVPRPGDLARLGDLLKGSGVKLEGVSWQ